MTNSTDFVIDLTDDSEVSWLSEEPNEQHRLQFTSSDLGRLDGIVSSAVRSTLVEALAKRDADVYFEIGELDRVVGQLLSCVGFDEISADEWLPSIQKVGNYEDFNQRRCDTSFRRLEREIPIQTLLGLPPEEELSTHATATGQELIQETPKLGVLRDSNAEIPMPELWNPFGEQTINTVLGPQRWANTVRNTIFDPATEEITEEIREAVDGLSSNRLRNAEYVRRRRSDQVLSQVAEMAEPDDLVRSLATVLAESPSVVDGPVVQRWLRANTIEGTISTQRANQLTTEVSTTPEPQHSTVGPSDSDMSRSEAASVDYEMAHAEQIPERDRSRFAQRDTGRRQSNIEGVEFGTDQRDSGKERLFFFIATRRPKIAQLKETVVRRLDDSVLEKLRNNFPDEEVTDELGVWTLSPRGPPMNAAKQMRYGDLALFYTEGKYQYMTRILGRTVDKELAQMVGGSDRRPVVVLLDESDPVAIPNTVLHQALGYQRSYPTWNSVAEERVERLQPPEAGLRELILSFDDSSDYEDGDQDSGTGSTVQMFSRGGQGHVASHSGSKMDVLQREMCDFVDTVHDDGRCLGAVSTFDTEVSVGEVKQELSSVKSTLHGLSTGGGTALYDSIVAVMPNWQRERIEADRLDVPSLLVTVTDGQDNESRNGIGDVREAIKDFGFHPDNNCYFVLVGVGYDASEEELRRICEGGLGMYRHVNHVDEVLRLVLAATLVGMVRQERYRAIGETADELSVRELRRELTAVGIQDLDYMLNIDSSGSMGNSA